MSEEISKCSELNLEHDETCPLKREIKDSPDLERLLGSSRLHADAGRPSRKARDAAGSAMRLDVACREC